MNGIIYIEVFKFNSSVKQRSDEDSMAGHFIHSELGEINENEITELPGGEEFWDAVLDCMSCFKMDEELTLYADQAALLARGDEQ